MSEKLSRKAIKHDKFVQEVGTAYSAAKRHVPLLVGAVVLVLAIVAAISGWFIYNARQERTAQTLLAQAIDVIETPLTGEMGAQGAPTTFASDAERVANAEPLFRTIIEDYSGRDAADVAGLYLANIEASRGEVESASQRLESFIDDHPDHLLAGGARISLYELRIASGAGDQVIAEIEQSLNNPESLVPTDALLALLARAYESTGSNAKSRDIYQRLVNEYPDSPYTLEAQRRLSRG